MNPQAKAAGHIHIGCHRPKEAAGGIGVSTAAAAAAGRRCGCCRLCCPLGLQLCHQLVNGGVGRVLRRHDGVILRLAVLQVVFQVQDDLDGLFNVLLQLLLLRLQLGLQFLQLTAGVFIIGLDALGILSGGDVGILKLPVALHNLAHVVHGGEHIGKAVRLGDDGQNIIAAVFLHGPDSGPVPLQLFIFQALGFFQLRRLLGDHLVV